MLPARPLSMIAAAARNGIIGRGNDLPWELPDDLHYFRETTRGHAVVMGRTTFDSIIARLGKPLPGRRNIILTRDPTWMYDHPDVVVVHDIDATLAAIPADDTEPCVIGGETIYRLLLSYATRVHLTEVEAEIEGDTYFPAEFFAEKEAGLWREVSRVSHAKDDRHAYAFDVVVWERV